jgi:hypothetical protein
MKSKLVGAFGGVNAIVEYCSRLQGSDIRPGTAQPVAASAFDYHRELA